jgi:hypothetical protein
MDEIITNWCIFNEYEEDYKLWWEQSLLDLSLLPKINSWNNEYNQLEYKDKYGSNACTIYAPIWMYSNNLNLELDKTTRLSLVDYRTKLKDFNPKVWWYLVEWIKAVCDIQKDCLFYKVPKQQVKALNNLWYYVNIWIYAWWDVNKADDDWVFTADEIENIKNANLGHSTLLKKDYRHDSYKGVKLHNQTKIEDIDKFINSWFVYQNAYLIIPNKVIKRYFESLLKDKNYKNAFEYYFKLSETLYKKEKMILQYVLQMKYLWKINNKELLDLKF